MSVSKSITISWHTVPFLKAVYNHRLNKYVISISCLPRALVKNEQKFNELSSKPNLAEKE